MVTMLRLGVLLVVLALSGCASQGASPYLWQRLNYEASQQPDDSWIRHHPTMVHMRCFPFYCSH